ncbi:hypothetical protein DCC62_22130 [candidate division KSB1 bacterium]|nr:MAG: hypothetical protein DCC62_22130 [candidate division KSB1 bacterium]
MLAGADSSSEFKLANERPRFPVDGSMPKITSTVNGLYLDEGEIKLVNGTTLHWNQISTAAPPSIPYGARIEVTVAYEEADYLKGSVGIVWATYHLQQAETIQAALLAQSITSELREQRLPGARLYLLYVIEADEVSAAVDFIWREPGGMRLKPDWEYPAGAANESFDKWINGV